MKWALAGVEARVENQEQPNDAAAATLIRVSTEIPHLGWRVACTRHQEIFVHVLRRAGIEDERDMELIRSRFLAWWSREAPAAYFEIVSTRRCGGCIAEQRNLDMARGLAKLTELAKELLSSRV